MGSACSKHSSRRSEPDLTTWSLYWPDWLTHWARTNPPAAIYGGWNQGTGPLRHVRPGDVVVPVTCMNRRLHILTTLTVETSNDDTDGSPHACAGWAVRGTWGVPLAITRCLPTEEVPAWTFRNADGKERPVKHVDGALPNSNQFQGCYRLVHETSDRIQALFGTQRGWSADAVLREIEERRSAAPLDHGLAEVHRDALMERGDSRGEVIVGELEDWTTRKRNAWVKKHPEVLEQPGGFPYVSSWAPSRKLRA